VKQAVESALQVKGDGGETAIRAGKHRRIGPRKALRPTEEATSTLKEGDAISIFEGK